MLEIKFTLGANENPNELARQLRKVADLLDGSVTTTATAAVTAPATKPALVSAPKSGPGPSSAASTAAEQPAKRGPGRPPKAKPAPEPEDTADEDTETGADGADAAVDDGLGFDDDTTSDEGEAKGPTLDDDIIPAFQAYAKKHTREKAAAILQKFKVKSVRDLPAAKYDEVLKILKRA